MQEKVQNITAASLQSHFADVDPKKVNILNLATVLYNAVMSAVKAVKDQNLGIPNVEDLVVTAAKTWWDKNIAAKDFPRIPNIIEPQLKASIWTLIEAAIRQAI